MLEVALSFVGDTSYTASGSTARGNIAILASTTVPHYSRGGTFCLCTERPRYIGMDTRLVLWLHVGRPNDHCLRPSSSQWQNRGLGSLQLHLERRRSIPAPTDELCVGVTSTCRGVGVGLLALNFVSPRVTRQKRGSSSPSCSPEFPQGAL